MMNLLEQDPPVMMLAPDPDHPLNTILSDK